MVLPTHTRAVVASCFAVAAFGAPAWAGQYTIEPCLTLNEPQPALALTHAHVPTASLRDEAAGLTHESRTADQDVAAFNAKCDADFDEGSPEDLDCAARRPPVVQKLQAERQAAAAFNDKARRLLADTEKRVRTRIETAKAQLARSSRENRQWQADIDDWLALADAARKSARDRALDTTIELALDGVHEVAERHVQLGEAELQRMRDWYNGEGRAFPPDVRQPLEDAVRRARTTRDVEQMLVYIYRQHGTAYRWIEAAQGSTSPSQAILDLITSLPTLGHLSPEAQMAISIGRLLNDVTYGWVAHAIVRGQVTQLIQLEASQFATVKRLAAAYVVEIDDLNALRRAERSCIAAK